MISVAAAAYARRTPLPAALVDERHGWPSGTTLGLRDGSHPDATDDLAASTGYEPPLGKYVAEAMNPHRTDPLRTRCWCGALATGRRDDETPDQFGPVCDDHR